MTVYLTPAGDRQVAPGDLDRKQVRRLRRAAKRTSGAAKPSTVDERPKDAA